MLGYVKTDAQELRMREYQYYRALYCGLCKRMGKCTGNCSRLSLSYDFVFLAAVRLAVRGQSCEIKQKRCLLHPFRKRSIAQKCDALDYAADASALLTYHKLADDRRDEKGFSKLRAILLRPLFSGAYRRAKKRHPELNEAIASHLSVLGEYENGKREFTGADEPAEQFGEIMAAVFGDGLEGSEARISSSVGRAVGHWIYLADAADDFEEDIKKKRFNPLQKLFGETLSDSDRETLRLGLTAQLLNAERALLLIDSFSTAELREILYNILYLGLPRATERVISKKEKEKTEKEN